MSGFEIAGIVLGSIPLIVSTLENYYDGVRTIQRWRKASTVLMILINDLDNERLRLQNVCEKLLNGLVPSRQIEAMVENPMGDLWLEKETQRKIRARLWRSPDVFERTMVSIQQAIEDMKSRLGDAAETKWSDRSSVVREFKRATFTLRRSVYAELLSTIQDGISKLETMIDTNIELEPQRRARSHVRLLGILRDLSSSMHRAIQSSLTCACKHAVSMRLSNWDSAITPIDDDSAIAQELKFHLALTSNSSSLGGVPTKEQVWKELLIQTNPLPSMSESPSGPSESSSSSMPIRLKKKKAVSFMASASFSSSTTVVRTETTLVGKAITAATAGVTNSIFSGYSTSMDLCMQLRETVHPTKSDCFGIIVDRLSPRARSYAVYPTSTLKPEGKQKWQMISLREALEGQSNLGSPTYLQRLKLAVSIASSVLQLYKTPWLGETLDSRNVFFIRKENFCYYDHPFILAQNNSPENVSNEMPIIRSPALLALGILLIELIRGQTIDALQAPDEALGNVPKVLSNYMTARRLLGEVYQSSSNYGSAVRRCVDGEFQRQKLDLDDEDFRQEVHSGVVALLMEDLKNASVGSFAMG